MGAFFVNCCIRGADQASVLGILRNNFRRGYVGTTVNGWTAFTTEDLDLQDQELIEDYGRALTRDSDWIAVTVLCHDEDVLQIKLFRDGEKVGDFDSDPSYFRSRIDEETKPVLRGAENFVDIFGIDETTIMELLPRVDHEAGRQFVERTGLSPEDAAHILEHGLSEGPLELHERWTETLGLPPYAIAMGYRDIAKGEGGPDWTST